MTRSRSTCAWFSGAVLCVGLLGCAPAEEGSPTTENAAGAEEEIPSSQEFSQEANMRALNATVADFATHLMAEDLDQFTDLFTQDAIRFPPEAAPIVGMDAIRAGMVRQFENVDQAITIRLEESEFTGDLAFVRGTFAVTQTTPDGSSGELVGSWMNLMRRSPDGRWRIARNMWNSDSPPS